MNYFSRLFLASNTEWSGIIDFVSRRVREEHNAVLLADVHTKEVKIDLVQLVQKFFSTAKFDDILTDASIVLIPKKQNPSSMADLRPISLCNIVYKVASKVLANRLKCDLNEMISESQSAFIPGRLISNNVMISYEVMQFMKRKVVGIT